MFRTKITYEAESDMVDLSPAAQARLDRSISSAVGSGRVSMYGTVEDIEEAVSAEYSAQLPPCGANCVMRATVEVPRHGRDWNNTVGIACSRVIEGAEGDSTQIEVDPRVCQEHHVAAAVALVSYLES